MVLKPSEIAPLNALLFAEVMEEAGTPQAFLIWSMVMVPPLVLRSHHT